MTPLVSSGVAEGLGRLRPGGGGAGVLGTCALVWVEGPDAIGFLQGLLSNDVAAAPVGSGLRALLLSDKGKLQADVRAHRDADDAYTLVVAPAGGGALAAALERYHFSEDLELVGPVDAETLTVGGLETLPAAGADLVLPGLAPGTWDLVGADARAMLAAAGLPEAPAEALEVLRVEAGAGRFGQDFTEANLVQEAGLEDVAVSFEKGCYLGQETVARVRYRGHVNRRLRGLRLGAPADEGATVALSGEEVGRVTSAALSPDLGPIALAMVRRAAEPDAEVVVEGSGPARVVALPFR